MNDLSVALSLKQMPLVVAVDVDDKGRWSGESLQRFAGAVNHARLFGQAQVLVDLGADTEVGVAKNYLESMLVVLGNNRPGWGLMITWQNVCGDVHTATLSRID